MKHSKLTFEYNKITDYIYLGTNQCCQIHFKKELLNKGIKADISLEKERIDAPFGVDYYLWLPVKDHTAPTLKQLKIGAKFIDNLTANKIKAYIHCQRGHGRAPTLVAAYLIFKEQSIQESIKFIKKKRPSIHPNKTQINALKRFKKVIKNAKI